MEDLDAKLKQSRLKEAATQNLEADLRKRASECESLKTRLETMEGQMKVSVIYPTMELTYQERERESKQLLELSEQQLKELSEQADLQTQVIISKLHTNTTGAIFCNICMA